MRLLPLLPLGLLAACAIDNSLSGKDDAEGFDEGDPVDTAQFDTDTDDPPLDEACNGEDDDGDGEIDEGFPDADGNGRVDCLDAECPALDVGEAGIVPTVEECQGTGATTVSDPWNAAIEWQYTSAGSGVIVMPAVGNLTDDNGDGQVDERDTPDIAFTTWGANTLVALHGDGSGEIFEVSGFDGQGGVVIADVDSDGEPEVVAIQSGYRVAAVDGSGNVEWTSSAFGMMAYPQPVVADLDADGDVEVIADVGVVNGSDGSTVATLSGITNSWRTPVAADLDQDGSQEIVLGDKVYDARGRQLWDNPGSGSGNFAAVADIDGDVGGEVMFVSGSNLYIHDDDGTLLQTVTIPGSNPGPPAVADFDGDGEVEIAIPANTWISVWDMDGTELWRQPIMDSSGLAGCSGYDVDGDGAYEVLYADQSDFRIYDGATGRVNYTNGNHESGTVWEYPVVTDIDQDGSAEVVIASNGGTWKGITVFGHAGDGWPKSGTTWGTHDFCVDNLEPDGSVPTAPDACWLTNNVFRARPSVDDPSSPDLVASITDVCVADCDYGPVAVSVQVANQGGADVDAGATLALYADDGVPRLVATVTLPAVPMGQKIEGLEVELSPADVGAWGFIAVVDDDGNGVGALDECDESNNVATYSDAFCP